MLVDPKECLPQYLFFKWPFWVWVFVDQPKRGGIFIFGHGGKNFTKRSLLDGFFFWTANFRCFCRMTSFSLDPCRLEDLPSGSVFFATVTCERIRFYGMKITIFSTTIFGIYVWHFCPTTGFQANLRRLSSYRYMHMDPMRRMLLKQVLGWITALHWG